MAGVITSMIPEVIETLREYPHFYGGPGNDRSHALNSNLYVNMPDKIYNLLLFVLKNEQNNRRNI